jgi:2-polyprenyl-3-methyl-5-hydroxy-6-metoxy-1,4-benzoquinol methylase
MELKTEMRCEVCDSVDWALLPLAKDGTSVTTSGVIVEEPLGKAQCRHCGLVQRLTDKYLGHGAFYEKSYQTYFNRVGAQKFDQARYVSMAAWMSDNIKPFNPKNILDVGCGRGWTILQMKNLFPDAVIKGVEPSDEDTLQGNANGLDIVNATLSEAIDTIGKFDVVYCNNVIQHSLSAREFIRDLKNAVTDDGLIVITAPDASTPSNEMMWCDQNFSLLPENLIALAEKENLKVHAWSKAPEGIVNLANKQLVVLSKNNSRSTISANNIPRINITENISARQAYVKGWQELDNYLLNKIQGKSRVFNFGASMWSYLLRGYARQYWKKVDNCLIDNFDGQFMDKQVLPIESINFTNDDVLVLGTEPLAQDKLESILLNRNLGVEIIKWNNRVAC